MWTESGVEPGWNFNWRSLFVWELELVNNLRMDLQGFERRVGEDGWMWNLEDRGVFTVSSMYKKLTSSAQDVWGGGGS